MRKFILFYIFMMGIIGLIWFYYADLRQRTAETDQTAAVEDIDLQVSQALQDWKEHKFSGNPTQYKIVSDSSGEQVLFGSSQSGSSILYKEQQIPVNAHPVLIWEWSAIKFPSNKKNERFPERSENDYAARIYVMFEGSIPFKSELIQYVWDDHFPEGTHASSPFAGNVKMLVIEQGPQSGWVREERDLAADYELLFGKKPKANIRAIGFMTDSDNTKSESAAYLKSFHIKLTAAEVSDQKIKSKHRPSSFDLNDPFKFLGQVAEFAGDSVRKIRKILNV